MAEYINRESFRNNIQCILNDTTCPMHISAAIEQYIDSETTADIDPVFQFRPEISNIQLEAEWKEYTGEDAGLHYCSTCGQQAFNYDNDGEVVEVLSNFCPYCGLPMTEEARTMLEMRLRGEPQ